MLTAKELRFTESFLAAMRLQDYGEFPIGTEKFDDGLKELARYLFSDETIEKAFEYDIDSLFSRSPTSGNYSRFVSALNFLNGRCLSFKNPRFIKATIEISEIDAKKILESTHDAELKQLIEKSVQSFVKGACLAKGAYQDAS